VSLYHSLGFITQSCNVVSLDGHSPVEAQFHLLIVGDDFAQVLDRVIQILSYGQRTAAIAGAVHRTQQPTEILAVPGNQKISGKSGNDTGIQAYSHRCGIIALFRLIQKPLIKLLRARADHQPPPLVPSKSVGAVVILQPLNQEDVGGIHGLVSRGGFKVRC